jgi:hypothetical protein
VHCSTGQYASDTYNRINYNFLPLYADIRLVVMPHTVQLPTFTDPAYDTYGNANFTAMMGFARQAALQGRRVM